MKTSMVAGWTSRDTFAAALIFPAKKKGAIE